MFLKEVYLGLGSNQGDSVHVIREACALMSVNPNMQHFKSSRLYQTAPVSDMPQADYINAVCRFSTSLDVLALWDYLQAIEVKLGKISKPKNAPRIIDIDILFFGNDNYCKDGLQIPHPRWLKRLFVIIPLLELTESIKVPTSNESVKILDLKKLIKHFPTEEMEKQCIKCL